MIVIKNLSVCMITCWYHNISMANYSENLINALMRRDVSVKVVRVIVCVKADIVALLPFLVANTVSLPHRLILMWTNLTDLGFEVSSIVQAGFLWDCAT